MLDQLIIENKSSLDDFDASLSGRKIIKPKKKSIKKSVAFSNITRDFSDIDGEPYWEEYNIEYQFEITADTPEELETKKRKFADWVMGIKEQNIYDPYIADYHFSGTYDDMTEDDDESLEKTTITVKFTAYPYLVANDPRICKFRVSAGAELPTIIVNNSSHRIVPTFITDGITVQLDGGSYTIPNGEITSDKIRLKKGTNDIVFKNTNSVDTNITVKFVEEVH